MKDNNDINKLWQQRIADFKKSGMSQKDWCKDNNVTNNQLQYWLYRKKSLQKESSIPSNTSTEWIPVDVSEEISIPKNDKLILKIGAVSIEIEPGYNKELLSDLISTLKSIC